VGNGGVQVHKAAADHSGLSAEPWAGSSRGGISRRDGYAALPFAAVPTRLLEAWETSEVRAYLTLAPGSPYEATVAVTALGEDRHRVTATWTDAAPRADSATVLGFLEARTLAHRVAAELAEGRAARLFAV
jgi:hypothetical protein